MAGGAVLNVVIRGPMSASAASQHAHSLVLWWCRLVMPSLLCRLWQEKQEKAFQVWLNALLTPQAAAPEDDGGLAAKRLHARVRGQIWHMYCSDQGVIGVMTRLETRVDEGFLRMKDEVRSSHRHGFDRALHAHRKHGLPDSVRERLSGLDTGMSLFCVSSSKRDQPGISGNSEKCTLYCWRCVLLCRGTIRVTPGSGRTSWESRWHYPPPL